MILNRKPINAWLQIDGLSNGGYNWSILPTSKWWRVDWYSRHYDSSGAAITAGKRTARSLGLKIVGITVCGVIQKQEKKA